MDIYQIVDVNERNELWTTKLFLYYYYHCPSASWNRSEYGDTRVVTVPPDTFWSPDITIQSAVQIYFDGYDKQAIWSSGYVIAKSTVISAVNTCHFDVTYFPFDSHVCELEFIPMITHNDIFYLYLVDEYLDLANYRTSEQWEIVTPVKAEAFTDAYRHGGSSRYTILRYSVTLKRRPHFYMMVLVYPIVTIYIFSGLTFLVPPGCGEKVSFAITILLAQIVAYSSLSQIFPRSSDSFPILIDFASNVTVHVGLLCCVAIYAVTLHHSKSKCMMGPKLQRIARSDWVRFIGVETFSSAQKLISNSEPENGKKDVFQDTAEDCNGINKMNLRNASAGIEHQTSDVLDKKEMKLLWQHLAVLVDRVMLILHALCVLCVLTYYKLKISR
ncbi:neuronal acetylcholine receptor subunit beta-3-like isoform X2 [Symsagittifera roscoffensis]